MIGIKPKGQAEFLDTMQDTAIEMTLENPLLGDADRLSPGSHSLPFSIPGGDASPKNAALLKNPDVIENSEAFQLQQADLYFDRAPFKTGTLKAKSTAGNTITAHFTFGLGALAPEMKTARLREVLDEEVVISHSAIVREIYIKKQDEETPARISINGEVYEDDTISGLSVLIQNYFTANMVVDGNIWLPWSDLVLVGSTPKGMAAPYIRLRMARQVTDIITSLPILQYSNDPHIPLSVKVDEDNVMQWKIEGFDMESYYDDFRTFSDPRLRFPVLFNADLHEPEVGKEGEIINGVDENGFVPNDPNYGHLTVRNINSLQPFLLLKYCLDHIAETFNFEYEGDFYEEPDLPTMLIDNSQTLDLPQDYIGEKKFIFWRRSFNLNELVPDISVVEFFKLLAGRYNLGIYYNEITRKVRLKKRELIARSTQHEDITLISSQVNSIEDLRSTGFKLTQVKEESDAFSIDETIMVGTPDRTIEIKCGRLHRTQSSIFGGGLALGPYVSRRNAVKFGFRIFHYIGLTSNGVYEYPSAAISGSVINETLTFFGVNLYEKFWKYWLLFETNRKLVKLQVKYPFRLVKGYDFELKRRFDRSDYLVKSLKIRMTNYRFEVSSVELLTMR